MEGMILVYIYVCECFICVDVVYWLFLLVQNVGIECECQCVLLLDWENVLLYVLVGYVQGSDSVSLVSFEFGLWFIYKGIFSFGESSEIQQVGQLMVCIDD